MSYITLKNADIEEFSNYLGFSGTDADMFYESYYNLLEEEDSLEDLIWSQILDEELNG